MKGSVAVVCGPLAAAGFRLAGVEPREVAEAAAAAPLLDELLASPGDERPLVVLVEDALLAALPPLLQRRLRDDPALIVVPFPTPGAEGAATAVSFLLDLLRQAIGYRVRLT